MTKTKKCEYLMKRNRELKIKCGLLEPNNEPILQDIMDDEELEDFEFVADMLTEKNEKNDGNQTES